MRVASTAVSLTTHVIIVLAAVWSTTHPRRPAPLNSTFIPLPIYRDPTSSAAERGSPVPFPNGGFPLPPVDLSRIKLPEGIDAPTLRFTIDARAASGPLLARTPGSDGSALDPSLVDELPMLLVGPHPAYPELLRQAGLQGRVVLEAVIDTLGRVEPASVVVVEAVHPAFVAPAQQSLLKSLFRPARVAGKAVRVRVRVPIDFVLRDGRLKG